MNAFPRGNQIRRRIGFECQRLLQRHVRGLPYHGQGGPHRTRPPLKHRFYCHTLDLVRFVWDKRKAVANLRKHGVSFEEASTAFEDELGAYYPDSLHEDRFILIGYSRRQRLLYVVHAEVTPEAIRIISARKATRHEKSRYEND